MTDDSSRPRASHRGGNGVHDLDELVAGYLDRLNSGECLDPMDILAEQPDHGSEILEELRAFLELESGGGSLGTIGDYTLRRQIGRGGMGVVYEAWQNSLDRQVALKILPAGIAADAKCSTRFLREAQILFGFTWEDQEFHFSVARAFADVADGLQHAHSRGVIHRDIKRRTTRLEDASTLAGREREGRGAFQALS